MGVTEQLAKYAIETPGTFLSPAVVESSTTKFLDTIGIMVAGSRSAAGRNALAAVQEIGGNSEATIVGRPEKTSVPLAGFINGLSAHALEYDDNTLNVGHASSCLVPGCLAVAEKFNLSGRQMLEAFVMGFEVASRIGKGLKPTLLDRGWHSIGLVGGQGVAVAACRMMGLDQLATRMAMALMASSGTGIRKNVGSMAKAFHAGNGVRAGLLAAILVRNGFQADPDIIEGSEEGGEGHQRFGLADAFNGIGNYRLDRMVAGLREDLELARNTTMLRMHPGSTTPGAAIDGIIELATTHNLAAEQVERVRIECHPKMLAIASYPEPSDSYRAKFCPPYTFAAALVDRKVGLAQYSDERIKDPVVLNLMRRIEMVVREDLKEHRGQWGEGGVNWGEVSIQVQLKDGRTLKKHCAHAKGWPENPASWGDLCAKFEECTDTILSRSQMLESISMIDKLAELSSVRQLTETLRTKPST